MQHRFDGGRIAKVFASGQSMRIVVLADIHGNREALDAVKEAVAAAAPDVIVIAGDIVGYGPDPAYAVEVAAQYAANGARVVLGNHDQAVHQEDRGMTKAARDAIHWTRSQLSEEHRAFLAGLPLTIVEEDRLYVHASANEPGRWRYILDAQAAESAQTHLAEPPDIETAGAPSPEGHGLRERLIAIMRALRRPMPPERLVAAIAQDDSSASPPQSQDVLAELGLMELDGVVTCGPEGFRLATGSG